MHSVSIGRGDKLSRMDDGVVDASELIDANAPPCPSCRQPMDMVIASWWCLDCQQAVHFDPV